VSSGSSPPQTPPQLSHDGRWVGDGKKWQPVPVVVGDLAGIVPVAAAAAAPAPAPARAAVVYSPPKYVAPPPEEPVVPLWQEPPRQGISMYLFVAAAAAAPSMPPMPLYPLPSSSSPSPTPR